MRFLPIVGHKCILDTGATATVITPPAARKGKVAGRRVSSSQAKGSVQSLAVGNAVVSNLQVCVFDPPQALPLRLDKGMDYGVILGYTFLSQFVTTIDYSRATVRFVPVKSVPRPGKHDELRGQGTAVPFLVAGNSILARVTINGREAAMFLVDTGSAEVLISPKIGNALGIKAKARADRPDVGFATVDRLAMGDACVTNVPVIIHTLPHATHAAGRYDGIIGYPFLSHFRVTVNYRDRILVLEPSAGESGPP